MTVTRRSLALASAVLVLSGCGPHKSLDLDIRLVSITVPRLITPAVSLVPPAAVPPPVSLPPAPPLVPFLPPPPAPATQAPVTAAPPPAPACPTAASFAVPERAAPLSLPGVPVPGVSVQARTGAFAGAPLSPSSGGLAGPLTTTIAMLPTTTSSAGQQVEAWSVERKDATGTRQSIEVYQLVHASSVASATAPGIYLVGLAWSDPVRGQLTFQPQGGGLFILPNPVAVATNDTQYAGTATDPSTLTTLSLVRNVTGKKRVDACGKLIDTFTVAMSGTLTTPDAQYQVEWTQHLATAYGGVDVEDTFGLTSVATGFLWTETVRNTTLPAAPVAKATP